MTGKIIELTKLATRLYDGPMWYGGNLKSTLENISWQQAFIKPSGSTHNIFELVTHMNSWRRFTVEHLKGNSIFSIEINGEDDWIKGYAQDEQTWNNALNDLVQLHSELVTLIPTVAPEKLIEKVAGKKFTWYVFLHGVIHHDVYHSGQIALLKKMATTYHP